MSEFDRVARDLNDIILPERRERIQQVVAGRTRTLTVILEMIEKGHNQSAILRSCDAFGVQDVHIIESRGISFRPQRAITQGVHKWLDLHRHKSALGAITGLQGQGFQVLVSALSEGAQPLYTFDLTGPTALLLGNELHGASPDVLDAADGTFVIPMFGFSQSFNVSVAAAISLHEAVRQRVAHRGQHGDLSEEERQELTRRFFTLSINDKRTRRIWTANEYS